jgi:hypothetical protein
MEDLNASTTKFPLFKKIDRYVFESIDKFKQTPNYNMIQDFYNGFEEEQQKVVKGAIVLILVILPIIFLTFLLWGNGRLNDDLEMRKSIVKEAQRIIGQNQGLRDVSPRILSQNPIDSDSMMTSRLSNLLSSAGIDLAKIQISKFNSTSITSNIMRSEADFAFSNVSTDELMNIFTSMIQRDKFRIESVSIRRNSDSNLLQGRFHAVHFASFTNPENQ